MFEKPGVLEFWIRRHNLIWVILEWKDLILLICEMLYLFVKGPSSIVNKVSSACSIESHVHTLIQNKMLSNFSFQAVYRITTFWNDFFYTNKLIHSYPKSRWKRNFIHGKATRIETNKKNVTDLWTYESTDLLSTWKPECPSREKCISWGLGKGKRGAHRKKF